MRIKKKKVYGDYYMINSYVEHHSMTFQIKFYKPINYPKLMKIYLENKVYKTIYIAS